MARKRVSVIPDIPRDASPGLRRWMETVKEAVEVRLGRRGDPGEAGVTFNDLIDAGIVQGIGRINPLTGLPQITPGTGDQPIYQTPPAPSNFVAMGVFGGIHLLWDGVAYQYGIVLTEVRRSVDADLANSSLIGVSGGSTYFDIIPGNQSETFWYWVRHVNANGQYGPWSQATEATKPEDTATIIERITGQIDESHLAESLATEIERIGEIDTALDTERQARIDADRAEANARVSAIQAEADARVSDIQAEADARIDAILAEQQARAAAISSEQSARLDGDNALAVRVDELAVKIDSLPVFSSGFEDGNDYNQWTAGAASTLAAETSDVYIGTQAARISSTATAPSASGIPGGVIAPIPEGTATAFAGKRIRVRVHAKQPSAGASAEFAVAYSTNDGDTSGWQMFTPDGTWQAFEFLYDVPAGGANTDYLSIWADTSGAGGELLLDAVSVEAVATDIPEFTAAFQTEQQARIDGDAALASELTLLEAEASDNLQAAIAQEQAARASLQEAVATDIGSLTARVGDNESEISTIQMAQADAEMTSALMRSLVAVQDAAASAMVRTEETARIEEDLAIASRVTTVEARIDDDISAAIQTEQTARASADDALALQIDTVQSSLGGDIAVVQQNLSSEVTRLDGRVDSNAQALTTAQSALGDDIAAVQTSLDTNISRVDGELVALGAQYTAKVQTNGLIGGFGIYNDGTEVDAGFDVDRFWVGRTNDDKRKPFIIQGGTTYIDEAMIRDASIQEGKLGPITVGKLRKPDGTPITTVAGLIRADAIDAGNLHVAEAARFSGDVSSTNYSPGASGWRILQNGTVEFNEGTFNGRVEFKNVTGAGALASKNSLSYGEVTGTKPPTNADKTSSNTAYDTARVGGTSAATVRDNAAAGAAADSRTAGWVRPNTTLINGNKIYTGDAYVDTLQIKNQAVTIPAVSNLGETSGSTLGNARWHTVGSAWLNPQGGGLIVIAGGDFYASSYDNPLSENASASASAQVKFRFVKADDSGISNSSVVYSRYASVSNSGGIAYPIVAGPVSFSYSWPSTSGPCRVDLQMYVEAESASFNSGRLSVIGAKR